MRILVATSSLGSGGAERVATTLCNAWVARGESVMLVPTFSGRGTCCYSVSPEVQLTFLADIARATGRHPKAYWRRFWALRRLIRTAKPDVIISFLTNVNVGVIFVSAGLGIPVVVCERTNPSAETQTSRSLRIARRMTYTFATAVTVQTQAAAEYFNSYHPRPRLVTVIPNPLAQEIAAVARRLDGRTTRKRLVAMGRFTEEKQFAVLVNTFAGLTAALPDWDLWMWGDGPLRKSIAQEIADLGLTSRAYLPGHTSDPWTELANADAFVLTSAFEGFPNALMEAMALGLPCVAFDCPSGPREITRNGKDALLVPLNNKRGLAHALERVMGDEDTRLRLSAAGRSSVSERYSLPKVLDKWDELFEEIGVRTKSK